MKPTLERVPSRIALTIAGAAWCSMTCAAHAEPAPPAATPTPAQQLEPIVVKGQALRGARQPYSVSAFTTEEIRAQQASHPQELLRWVPGMHVRSLGLGGVADPIVLRGFASGAHGGDIGFVVDGIPLNEAMSHSDGYADLSVLIPLEIDALTVFRGPVSPLYGNFNRGGLVAIDTRQGGVYRQGDFSVGTHGSGDAQVALGARLAEGQHLNLAAQATTSAGFRPQSDHRRATLAARWSVELTPALQLALSGRTHWLDADNAAYLTQQQFRTDPFGIDPRVQNDGAKRRFTTLRADLNHDLSPQLRLLTFAYRTHQDFTRWFTRPTTANPADNWRQREETYRRSVFGAGISLNGRSPVAGSNWTWVAGVETFRESTDYLLFDGLNRRARVDPAQFDRRATLDSVSAFGELQAPLHPLLQPTLGLRHDRFDGECTRLGPETGNQPCGPLADLDHLSPKIGVRSDLLPRTLQLRASWAEGFALPGGFIKYAIGAAELRPNVIRQTEVGATLRLPGGIKADLAWYRIDSTQEIRTVAPGVFENFGATRRDGIEASLHWSPLDDLLVTLAWGRADSEITGNADPALLGRHVPGVPRHATTLGLNWAPAAGLGASATLRAVGRKAVNAANTIEHAGVTTLDLGLTHGGRWGATRYRAYLRVDNALDRTYASSKFLIGGQLMYGTAAPRSVRVGVQFDL
jgi:outer membrane cobalamin receptor